MKVNVCVRLMLIVPCEEEWHDTGVTDILAPTEDLYDISQ